MPLNDTFLGLMATVELPLLFFSVVCGILGIGNSAVFGKILLSFEAGAKKFHPELLPFAVKSMVLVTV